LLYELPSQRAKQSWDSVDLTDEKSVTLRRRAITVKPNGLTGQADARAVVRKRIRLVTEQSRELDRTLDGAHRTEVHLADRRHGLFGSIAGCCGLSRAWSWAVLGQNVLSRPAEGSPRVSGRPAS
jgi:hypothetical protein